MSYQKRISLVVIFIFSLVFASIAEAQRPTPEPPKGTIQGVVYEDVNGDGQCVNTGVEGEKPVGGVDIEFVSSDEQTVITLYSGPEGIYGLFEAGQSYWKVTANPNSDWVVTSENPLYAPVVPESLAQTGINFCVQSATTARRTVLLPEAGAPASSMPAGLVAAALTGLIFMVAGALLYRREQAG